MTRTLINLAINAIKFSPAGSTVHIRLRSEESAKQVRIAVQDQGPGIASDQTQQIFKRFNRLHQAQAVPKTGFGLGLNIAEELVELNLGQISLESVVGEGSTFSFTVPVADWPEVLHRHLQRVAQDEQEQEASIQISVIRASLVQPLSDAACQQGPKEIQAFLNCLLFSKDLLLPMEDDVWLVVLTAGRSGAECFLERIGKETESVNRNRAQGALPELKLEDLGTVVGAENLDSLQQLLTRNAPALTCSAQRGTLCAI